MLRAYPQADTLPPDAAAALLSLVFNRGAALGGSTRVEMANIKAHLQSGNLAEIPTELKRMKRLWPDTAGLRNRRDDEAELFESALA
jgi:GH24 family phage-related lysozyme (muramidase)